MKKVFYFIFTIYQGALILSTMVNLIFNICMGNIESFYFSIPSILTPYDKFIHSGSPLDLFVLALFLVVTITFYILSTRELFDSKIEKAPFFLMNFFWVLLSSFTSILIYGKTISICIFQMILLVIMLVVLLLKWSQQNKAIRNNVTSSNADSLPENFQMSPKSYKQIERTAKGLLVIELGALLLCFYLMYFEIANLMFLYGLYSIIGVLAIIVFLGTIFDCKKIEKNGEKAPTGFMKKLNTLQILSCALSVIFAVITFIFNC